MKTKIQQQYKIWYFLKKQKQERFQQRPGESFDAVRKEVINLWPKGQVDLVDFYTEEKCKQKHLPTT